MWKSLPFGAASLLVLLLLAGPGLAQSEPPPKKPDPGMDLPVPKEPSGEEEPEEEDKPGEEDPPVFYDEDIPVFEGLTYVIDVSGSMVGGWHSFLGLKGDIQRGNRMDRAKVELIRSIRSLPETYTFNIVAFHCWNKLCFPGKVPATETNKKRATQWVSELMASGGTSTAPAVLQALDEERDTIILLTDGAPGHCDSEPPFLLDAEPIPAHEQAIVNGCKSKEVRCHTFGIDDYGEFQAFLVRVASQTGGSYTHVR